MPLNKPSGLYLPACFVRDKWIEESERNVMDRNCLTYRSLLCFLLPLFFHESVHHPFLCLFTLLNIFKHCNCIIFQVSTSLLNIYHSFSQIPLTLNQYCGTFVTCDFKPRMLIYHSVINFLIIDLSVFAIFIIYHVIKKYS